MKKRSEALKVWSDIRDPVHGYIFVTELERKLIDTSIFQRLHNIRQLAGAQLCYPGADHTRFGHSLGVMHLAGLLTERLVGQGYLDSDSLQEMRLAGLLHDIGHGPFSHIYEEISLKHLGKNQEDLSTWLVLNSEVKDILESEGYDVSRMSRLCVGKYEEASSPYINQIISGPVDVDKMDFLVRDSHFTGVEYGRVDTKRLLYSLEVSNSSLTVSDTALYALEAFLIARYEMFKAVYYHRTVRAAEVMLMRAMEYAHEELGLTTFKTSEEFAVLDDYYVTTRLRMLKGSREKKLRSAHRLIEMFDRRELLKCACERIVHVRDKFMANILTRPSVRREIEEEIAEKAGVNPDSVIVDTPTLPSVPYNPRLIDPLEIPILTQGGTIRLSDVSGLINVLKVYLDVVRVYTDASSREKVGKASTKVFGEGPVSTQVSY